MSLYTKIADEIMEKIKTEEWSSGYMIPSEKELCEQFKVSRPTIRAALSILVNQGYLKRIKGKGSFVSRPKILEDTTVFLESFSRELATKGMKVQTEVLEQRIVAADEEVAERLGVHPGDDVFKLVRLRYVEHSFDHGPIVYNITYFPAQYKYLLKYDFESESLISILRRNHVDRRYLEKNIKAVLLKGKISRILGVPEDSLGIMIDAVSHTEEGEVVEHTLSYYPSDRNTFLLKISV